MNNPKDNRILSALPETEYQHLIDFLEPIQLSLNQVLIEAGQKSELLYFPTQGIVSLISVMSDGSSTEIGLIGREGMVGTPQFLGSGVLNSRTMVQVKGTAMQIKAEVLRSQFEQSKSLQKILLGYTLKLFNQVSQGAACNNHHTVKQRTARWLLMLDDRSRNENKLVMTQQLLSKMLGVRRTGISEIANKMKQQGIINYQRGAIIILDRQALEAVACECYQLIKDWSAFLTKKIEAIKTCIVIDLNYTRASNPEEAISGINSINMAKFLGGGTNLLDLLSKMRSPYN